MTLAIRYNFTALWLILALLTECASAVPAVEPAVEPAAEPSAERAVKLWSEFLKIYAEKSMEPVKADDLDQRTRLALLKRMKIDFSDTMVQGCTTLPLLVEKIATRAKLDPFDLTELAIQSVMPLVDTYGDYYTSAEIIEKYDAKIFAEKEDADKSINKGVILMRLFETNPKDKGVFALQDNADKPKDKSIFAMRLLADKPTYKGIFALQEDAYKPKPKGAFKMQLLFDKKGALRCYPDPDGPAAKAGCPSGAILTAVNSIPLAGKNIAEVEKTLVGKETANLLFTSNDGKTEAITVHASHDAFPDVQVYDTDAKVRLRIRNFSEGTAVLIKSEMSKYPELNELTLDLRGNVGGLLQEALLTCSLFLPKGAVISHDIVDEKKVRKRDDNDVFIKADSIIIRMDGATASGAELLINCLKFHMQDKVKITGTTSYGKHYRTVRTPLLHAGMLTVTDGIILGPDGNTWPETGITPDN